jgi:diguanylate cyclase (GGDEF)-like protein
MKKKTPFLCMKTSLPLLLLVSKDQAMVALFEKTLKTNFFFIHVSELAEAFQKLKDLPVALLILGKDPFNQPLEKICKNVQKITKAKNFPILLIANSMTKEVIITSLSAGITDFIHEPLDTLKIHERIAVCLHSRATTKKMKTVTGKIKTTAISARNPKMFLEKTVLRDQTHKVISTAKKGAVPLSVLMIHLDTFAKLQKILSANALKEIFQFLENFLKGRLRKYDTFMVEGPGQYLILLPKTSESAARIIAEDLRKEVSMATISTSSKEILVTVSIGVVSFEKELSKSAKDFEQFDLCLERVKKSLLSAQKKGTTII